MPTATPQVYETMDLALRIGEVLLSSGESAVNTAATIARVLESYDVLGANVDVTFTAMTLSYQGSPSSPPETHMRVVQYRTPDYSRLTRCADLVLRISDGELTRTDARAELEAITSAAHPYRKRLAALAWGVVGAAVAVLLGGDLSVVVSAFVSAVTVHLVNRGLHRLGIPLFFQQLTGAFVATTYAALLYASGLADRPSLVLVSGIVILLAGMAFVGAIEDALTGYYITASARLLEVGVLTGGIIAGVSMGLAAAAHIGVSFQATEQGFALHRLPLLLAAAGLAAAAGAYASYAPRRSLVPAAVAGLAGEGVFCLLTQQGVAATWSAGVAAVVVAGAAHTFAGRLRLPVLLLTSSGIVPLLPGLAIYTGLFQLTNDGGNLSGILKLAGAMTTAAALAAGVLLGSRLARPVKAGGRRIELHVQSRLSGPRNNGSTPSL